MTASRYNGYSEKSNMSIPIPDASKRIKGYENLYFRDAEPSKSLIKFVPRLEEFIEYDVDENDINWLRSYNSVQTEKLDILHFESIMQTLENLFLSKCLSLNDTFPFVESLNVKFPKNVSRDIIEKGFEYWKFRGRTFRQQIIPKLQVCSFYISMKIQLKSLIHMFVLEKERSNLPGKLVEVKLNHTKS